MTLNRRWTWKFGASRERLWTYVADTDWVNEHAGLPPIEATFEPLADGGSRRIARMRAGPLAIEWEERPTIWQAPQFFIAERLYRRGPLARFWTRTTLEPCNGGTEIVVSVALDAAWPTAKPLLPLLAARGKRGLNRAFALAAKLAADGAQPNAASREDDASRGAFAPLAQAGIDREIAGAMARFVAEVQSRDARRIRPYELADRWGVSRRETLRAFLRATRLGLLDLQWTVLCPSCRGANPGVGSLEELHRNYHCDACNVTYDPAFDRSVEVTFDARPLGHTAEPGLFCLASPQRSSHVRAQTVVTPQARQRVELALPRGSYQLNAPGLGTVPFVASEEEAAAVLTATVGPGKAVEAGRASSAAT